MKKLMVIIKKDLKGNPAHQGFLWQHGDSHICPGSASRGSRKEH